MLESVPAALVGAVGLGLLHGAEPGHGWPVAATYALEKPNKWVAGFAASSILGIGHLISSLAVVGAFFLLKSSVGLESMWWLDYVAGGLLILLGVHEYRSGHAHGHGGDDHEHGHGEGHDPGHDHAEHDHSHSHSHSHHDGHDNPDGHSHDHSNPDGHSNRDSHSHDHADGGRESGDWVARVKAALPFGGGHSHDHGELEEAADRGLWSIAGAAFVLGFAHEEEFEIIGLCAGSSRCLELMTAYAVAVVVGIVALTLLLVAGYERYEDRVKRWAVHFPTISAAVLILMGVGFIAGVL